MNYVEAVAAGLTCDVLAVWLQDDRGGRISLFHIVLGTAACAGGDKVLCGRDLSHGGSRSMNYLVMGLATFVEELQSGAWRCTYCADCSSRFRKLNFREGEEPS